ncbi:MAG: type ISP restriction/modification enzyme, partial [Candidatus Hodarchaeales archaeon]
MSNSNIFDSSLLIEHMVNLAVLLKDEITNNRDNGVIIKIYDEFNSYLDKTLEFDKFADIYAQIFVYGLFSAQIIRKNKINLNKVPIILGRANHLLEKTFSVFNQDLSRIINPDKIGLNKFLEFLNKIDLVALINWFTEDEKSSNPLIHFYESFLADYNPQMKLKRGVFYTPDVIVSFIIRSVDILLKDSLNFNSGLNDPSVIILDPAMGTGTFLNEIVKTVKENYDRINTKSSQEKRITDWNHYITDSLLKRIFGFEVMITPHIIAHLQLALLLETTGYDLTRSKDRIGVFLTNTLEGTHENKNNLTRYLSNDSFLIEETDLINEIKINTPISVIVGNPPYSKFSSNKECHWIEGLIKGTITDGVRRSSYYEIDGEPLQERKTHLLDDYVKFIRFAQWRIEKTGYGIVAFITNHGFMSNPTFRGMRQQLLKAFDQLFILDLHGNILKGETTPDGSKDENVFDIKQGISIIFMIKNKISDNKPQIFHFDLWGTRNKKYEYLRDNDVASINWTQIFPRSPDYFFYPIDWTLWEEYNKGWKLTDIFSEHGVGIVTARDKLTIHSTKEDIWNTVIDFGTLSPDEARKKYKLGKDAESWGVLSAQEDLRKIGLNKAVSRENEHIKIIDETFATQLKKQFVKPINYRPFNKKYTFYTGTSNGFLARPVYSIMKHLLQENNLSLITTRLTKGEEFKHVFATQLPFEQIFLSSKTSNSAYSFPLYC